MPISKFLDITTTDVDNVTWTGIPAPAHNGAIRVTCDTFVAWSFRTDSADSTKQKEIQEGVEKLFEQHYPSRSLRAGELFIWVKLSSGTGKIIAEGHR
jgi:hypothetical protein